MPSYHLSPEVSLDHGDLLVGDPSKRGNSWLLLGSLAEAGGRRRLKLDTTAEHVLAVIGKRGTGKSYTLGVVLEGLGCGEGESPLGRPDTSRAALVLDVLDVFWTSALPLVASPVPELQKQFDRMRQGRIEPQPIAVDIWIPAGYSSAEIDLPETRTWRVAPSDLLADDWASMFDIDIVSEPRGMLLEELVRKVSTVGWTDGDGIHQVPMPVYSVDDLLECLEGDPSFVRDYADGTIRSIRQRLSSQAANPLFQGAPTPLSDLLRSGRVSVMMLGRLADGPKQVIASLLARQIMRERREVSYARKRLDLDSRLSPDDRARLEGVVATGLPRTWLLADEAQVLAPSDRKTLSGETLVRYAKEGRNYGLSLGIATQQPTAVDARLMSQVETLIVHQLTAKQDIDVALKSMKAPLPETIRIDGSDASADTLIRTLEQGEALFSCANAGRSMTRAAILRVRPRVTAHGGYEA